MESLIPERWFLWINKYGVQALVTQYTTVDGIHPTNPKGVTFTNGQILPTWDGSLNFYPHPKRFNRVVRCVTQGSARTVMRRRR